MYTAIDINAYFKQRLGESNTKLKRQKLLYFAQAWHLAWYGTRLFADEIQAWKMGPVTVSAYENDTIETATRPLDAQTRAHLDAIIDYYGQMYGTELTGLSHEHPPWKNIWDGGRGQGNTISPDALFSFYSQCQQAPSKPVAHDLTDVSEEDFAAALADATQRLAGVNEILADR